MTTNRAVAGKLYMAEAVPFGQRFTYASPHPIDETMQPGYWVPLKNNLRVGDEIRVCYVLGDRLREDQDLAVVQCLKQGVEVQAKSKRFIYPEAKTEAPEPTHSRARPDYEVKRGYQCFQVVIAGTGKLVSEHATKKEAEDVIASLSRESVAA
jgi:hypothetical protein